MTHRRSFRRERARAAAALLTYLGHPCPETERTLLEAAHDLEAAAAIRRLGAVSQRRRAAQLEELVAH
jgi:hypothetical protein